MGQQQQGSGQLFAQQHGQQNSPQHSQKEAQRQGADVHAPQAVTRQGPLLVFAVGRLHLQRIVDQCGGQVLGHHEQAPFFVQSQAPLGKQHQDLDPTLVAAGVGFVQTLHPGHGAILTGLTQLLRRGPIGTQLKARWPGVGHHLPALGPDGDINRAQLGTDFFSRQSGVELTGFGPIGGGCLALFVQVFTEGVQRRPPQVETRHQGRLHFDVKPAFNRTRDKLVRHHINEQTGNDAHQSKDARQFDQQA